MGRLKFAASADWFPAAFMRCSVSMRCSAELSPRRTIKSRALIRSSSSVTTTGSGALGAIQTIVGKSIAVNGHPFTIIGVTPPDFFGVLVGESPDLWAPTMMYAQIKPGRSIEEYFNDPLQNVLARLNPEISEQQVTRRAHGPLTTIATGGERFPTVAGKIDSLCASNASR